MKKTQSGFTLVEAMLAMVIVSIGALALQSFYTAVIRSQQLSQERLIAVHMAEQIIEGWQQSNTDLPPTVDCTEGSPTTLTLDTAVTCTPTGGNSKPFSITAKRTIAMAPMPNNPGAPTWRTMPGAIDIYGNPSLDANGTPIEPMVRTITINWDYKGETKTVMLTHLTRAR